MYYLHESALPKNRVIGVPVDDDYRTGRELDLNYLRQRRGHRVRLGLPGELRGALALGCLPDPNGHVLPRCLVICWLNGNWLERVIIPEESLGYPIEEALRDYADPLGRFRAKALTKVESHVLFERLFLARGAV